MDVETLVFSDSQELIVQRANFPPGGPVDARFAQGIHPELISNGVIPRAHQNPEVGGRFIIQAAEQILARRRHIFPRIAHKQIASLCQCRHQARFIDTAIFLRRQQHARVPGVHGECEHAPAQCGDRCVSGFISQRAKIQQQLFRMGQSGVARSLEPAEVA